MPFLTHISTPSHTDATEYPFTIPSIKNGMNVTIEKNVTFLVGENGSGKSTVLEAIADKIGFNINGGNRNQLQHIQDHQSPLSQYMRLAWRQKVVEGFFMRAESFFNFASYLDQLAAENDERVFNSYGGKSLHHQSHGESFLALFSNRFEQGIYILDEPEAALSPQRQLSFLSMLHNFVKHGDAQFIIATHSPILLSYPHAQILDVDNSFEPIAFMDTNHYTLTKSFLDNPEAYFRHLFED
jgi:predicted ATPase